MAFMAESFFSGCISKVINDGKDYSWAKIKSVINDKNDRNLSTRIYRVIEKTLIKVTDKKFKGMDILYEAIEKIFIEFRNHGSSIESAKCGLGLLIPNASYERCENFIQKFYDEVCKDDNLRETLSFMLQVKVSEQVEAMQKDTRRFREGCNVESDLENTRKLYNKNGALVAYSNNFQNTLFLHKNTKDNMVTLKDLYVLPLFVEFFNENRCLSKNNILGYLKNFLYANYNPNILFIEADAGVGKSSLCSYLAYIYLNDKKLSNQLFGNKQLICVRLRDLELRMERIDLVEAILKYLNYNDVNQLEIDKPEAVILLDGLDELCMIEEITNNVELHVNNICRTFSEYKVIITTRPMYLKISSSSFSRSFAHIKLEHLAPNQVDEWCNKYLETSPSIREIETIKYIMEKKLLGMEDVFDTAMGLYLVVAGKITHEALKNKWVLYHQIFYRELLETEYNKLFNSCGYNYSHAAEIYKDIIYNLSSNIAFYLFQLGNKRLYIRDIEIEKIIESMAIGQCKAKEFLERCYALCCYWKPTENKGTVEFYHNNIRDFFMGEKILNKLNEFYEEDMISEKGTEEFYELLNSLFTFMKIEPIVAEFIYMRLKYKMEAQEQDYFIEGESKNRYFEKIFEKMIVNGNFLVKSDTDNNALIEMINMLHNSVLVYRQLYYILDNKINFWKDYKKINQAGIFKVFFNKIFSNKLGDTSDDFSSKCLSANNLDLSNLDLSYCDLHGLSFNYTNFSNTDLAGCILIQCDFRKAIYDSAVFTDANLKSVKFSRHNKLPKTNLTGAVICDN